MALTAQQAGIAQLLVGLAQARGLGPGRAHEFAAAAMAESGLNPHSRNTSSGAAGLFQLLSPGYRQKAQSLGGLDNPRANALAILPDYLNYWRSHPGAVPGQAGAAVERSGQGAGFYARPLSQLSQIGGAAAAPAGARPVSSGGLAGAPGNNLKAIGQALIAQVGQRNPDYANVFTALQQRTAAPTAPLAAPAGQPMPTHAGSPASAQEASVVALAHRYIGTPYKWGGTSPKTGFDCSGFVQWLYSHAGVKLPRTSQQQFRAGTPVAKGQLRPGDLLFFEPSMSGPGHEGLYIGNGRFIESPHTGASVRVSTLANRSDYVGARRVG